jgi:hypothetical protein
VDPGGLSSCSFREAGTDWWAGQAARARPVGRRAAAAQIRAPRAPPAAAPPRPAPDRLGMARPGRARGLSRRPLRALC